MRRPADFAGGRDRHVAKLLLRAWRSGGHVPRCRCHAPRCQRLARHCTPISARHAPRSRALHDPQRRPGRERRNCAKHARAARSGNALMRQSGIADGPASTLHKPRLDRRRWRVPRRKPRRVESASTTRALPRTGRRLRPPSSFGPRDPTCCTAAASRVECPPLSHPGPALRRGHQQLEHAHGPGPRPHRQEPAG